jgi:hypothetical protein
MMATAPLLDLLPSLFYSAVLQLTRRPLLSVERNALLAALVNSIGESVMRRARDARGHRKIGQKSAKSAPATPNDDTTSASDDVTYIETFDRFSDEWIPRVKIIENMECSSGLDRRLSEFALFLIESRLDLLLSTGSPIIVGIGHVSPAKSMNEVRPSPQDVLNNSRGPSCTRSPPRLGG